MSLAATARRAAARLWWYVSEFTGERAYDRYVERACAKDPAAAVLSRREFERRRVDERLSDPRNGPRACC